MNSEDLHLLIHEEIYAIKAHSGEQSEESHEDIAIHRQEVVEEKISEKAPDVPVVDTSKPSEEAPSNERDVIPVAIFHEATSNNELDLLQKIIAACGLEVDQYTVFASGFNKEVKFAKGLIFVSAAKKFYEVIPYQTSQILCSKPLDVIASDQNEKVKLWNALKRYLGKEQ